jgi:uncharacterized membrane protein
MDIRKPLIFSLLVIAAMLIVSMWGWMSTPPDAHIPVHWGLDFRPNGYAPKAVGLLMLPGMVALLSLLFATLPIIEPRRVNLFASRKLYLAGWYGAVTLLAVLHFLIAMTAVGALVDVPRTTLFAVALLVIVLGNFMGKSRSTFFVGLRLPWTLSSELAWSKSNRLAGFGFVTTGFATLLALVFATTKLAALVLVAGLLLGSVIAGVAAYFTWKHDDNKYDGDSIHE